MQSQTDMLEALGGTPVAMAYGDVYTSLQTGIIDGTENNETALTTGKHGEICKVFSMDQHAMIPDVLVMGADVWNSIAPEDQQIILEAAYWAAVNTLSLIWFLYSSPFLASNLFYFFPQYHSLGSSPPSGIA